MKQPVKETVKQVMSVICFLLIAVLIMFKLTTTAGTSEEFGRSVADAFEAEEEDSLGVIFLGSSAIYRYICSPQLWDEQGFTSYVYGTAGQPFEATQFLMEECLYSQNPDLFVVEIRSLINYSETLNAGKELSGTKRAYYLQLILDSMSHQTTRLKFIDYMNGEISTDDALSWFMDLINDPNWDWDFFNNEKNKLKGNKTVAKHEDLSADFFDVTGLEEADVENAAYVLKLIDDLAAYAKENNIQILFVSTPYVENENTIALENNLGKYIETLGFNYLNCNYHYEEMGIDFAKDFYNDEHVNVYGAIYTTSFIGQYITDNYDVTTSYDKAVVKDWDKSYDSWLSYVTDQKVTVDQLVEEHK